MFRMKDGHKRDLRYTLLCILVLLTAFLLMAVAGGQDNARPATTEPNRVEEYSCGKATGLHDGKPGYHITQHAHYREAEDGSGVLLCGRTPMVIVHVPW